MVDDVPAWSCQPRRPLPALALDLRAPRRFHQSLSGYAPTPLVSPAGLARAVGVGALHLKDESHRIGLPSFKVLGASWATARTLCAHLGLDQVPALDELRQSLKGLPPLSLAAATDGNHGRAVARMAHLLGLACTIYVPAGTTAARIAAIEGEGASVVVVDGTYDDAVRASAAAASGRCLVVSDTSWPGYEEVPRWVVEGYGTIFAEISDQLSESGTRQVDVVVVPVGVGALAAAAVTAARNLWPDVRLLGIEPTSAACVLRSLQAGRITEVPGPHTSVMVGLNCGTPSLVAWPTVSAGLDAVVAVEDEVTFEAVRDLHEAGIRAGETGAAAYAGLLALAQDERLAPVREHLGLTAASRVVAVMTEGVTDAATTEAILAGAVPA